MAGQNRGRGRGRPGTQIDPLRGNSSLDTDELAANPGWMFIDACISSDGLQIACLACKERNGEWRWISRGTWVRHQASAGHLAALSAQTQQDANAAKSS